MGTVAETLRSTLNRAIRTAAPEGRTLALRLTASLAHDTLTGSALAVLRLSLVLTDDIRLLLRAGCAGANVGLTPTGTPQKEELTCPFLR